MVARERVHSSDNRARGHVATRGDSDVEILCRIRRPVTILHDLVRHPPVEKRARGDPYGKDEHITKNNGSFPACKNMALHGGHHTG